MSPAPSVEEIVPDWLGCTRCDLHKTRRRLVFGTGNQDADILLVGEAPGEEEDIEGKPFVGESGRTLNIFLDMRRLDRDTDMFITNVVCCRPFNLIKAADGSTKKENRTPSGPERAACWPRLEEIIYRVDPLIIVTMGKTPTTQVLGRKGLTMEAVRGRVQSVNFPGHHTIIRYPVLPMYHPAYLLRNQNREEGGPWHKTTEDFILLTSLLDKLRAEYYGTPPPDRESHIEEFLKANS